VLLLLMSALLATACLASGFTVGGGRWTPHGDALGGTPADQASRFRVFWQAWHVVEGQFYATDPLDPQQMTYGAIAGLLAALGDPYAGFSNPPAHRLENDSFSGDFGGIGASLAIDNGIVALSTVHPLSPAEAAGLRSGDRLLAVDGIALQTTSLDELALAIRGSPGSTVRLDVQRQGQPLTFGVVRATVELPSVWWQALASGLGYIRIERFSGRTPAEVGLALNELQTAGAKALLLDLRDNAGGLAATASGVLAQLLDGGIAYREMSRDGQEQRIAIPFGVVRASTLPLAVLVNHGTASAAEIVAAAVQDHGRGPLVGEHTYGKGSVQILHTLSDGSSIRITTTRWLTPSGSPIEGVGLLPDIVTAPDQDAVAQGCLYLAQSAGTRLDCTGQLTPNEETGKVLV